MSTQPLLPLLAVLACAPRTAPVSASPELSAPERPTPEEGWYNASCYAALDGRVDEALDLLAESIRRGEAPLSWMGATLI